VYWTTLVLGGSPSRIHLLFKDASFVCLEVVFCIFALLDVVFVSSNATIVSVFAFLCEHFFVQQREKVCGPARVLETFRFAWAKTFVVATFDHVNAVDFRVGKQSSLQALKILFKDVVMIMAFLPRLLLRLRHRGL